MRSGAKADPCSDSRRLRCPAAAGDSLLAVSRRSPTLTATGCVDTGIVSATTASLQPVRNGAFSQAACVAFETVVGGVSAGGGMVPCSGWGARASMIRVDSVVDESRRRVS